MMQAYHHTPPVASQCHGMPSPTAQMEHYRRQQMMANQQHQQSHGLQDGQTLSQPVASSSDFQARQTAEMILRQAWTNAAHHGTLIQNTVPQQNFNMDPSNTVDGTNSWYHSEERNANSSVEQNLRHLYQPVNGPHHREHLHQPAAQPPQTDQSGYVLSNQALLYNHNNQIQTNGTPGNGVLGFTFNPYSAAPQRHITPPQVSNHGHPTCQSHSSQIGNQCQHSLQTHHQPPPYSDYGSYSGYNHQSLTSNQPSPTTFPPAYTGQHFVIQNQNQRTNQSVQLAVPHGSSLQFCYNATYTTHQQNNSHVPSKTSCSEKPGSSQICSPAPNRHSNEIQRAINHQAPVQRTAVLKENEQVLGKQLTAPDVASFQAMPSRGFQTDSISKKNDGCKSNTRRGEVQYSVDVAETLELYIALERVLQQSHKSVAVVPPISQQVPSPEKINPDMTTSNDSLPFKIDSVWTLAKEGKNMEGDSAPNLPQKIIEELLQFSEPHPKTKKSDKPEDESTVNGQKSDTPVPDVPQSKVDSSTSTEPVCSPVLETETVGEDHRSRSTDLEDHNEAKTDKPDSNIVDLSKVEVLNFTMENFNNWVQSLENQPEKSLKGKDADIVERLLDLFYNGEMQNLKQLVLLFPSVWSSLTSQVSEKDMQTAVFEYLQPEDLSKLKHGYHILKNNTTIPSEEFRSSWLNVDDQPADIKNILEEPISDLNLTDYALPTNFNPLDFYSEIEPSTEVSHESATDCQNDKMINKELAKPQVSESKYNGKVVNAQDSSKKHEDGNLEKPLQQNGNLGPEESEASNDTADRLSKVKRTESEQDATRESVTSSESVEQGDLSDDAYSSCDSELIEYSLLSPDDTRRIFKEQSGCDSQKEPSELCRDGTKDPVTTDNNAKDFCNSSELFKFTCPHVSNINWNGEHFCPMCWEETPLLDLDLEEALFSPGRFSPEMRSPPTEGHHDQSCIPQPGNPTSCTALLESSIIINSSSPTPNDSVESSSSPTPNDSVESSSSPTPKDAVESSSSPTPNDAVESSSSPTPNDAVESSSSPTPNDAVESSSSPTPNDAVESSSPPTPNDAVESSSSPTPKDAVPEFPLSVPDLKSREAVQSCALYLESLLPPYRTKTPRDEVFPPKKSKLSKRKKRSLNDSSTADVVDKKPSLKKPHLSDLTVTPAEKAQNCGGETKERRKENSPVKQKIQSNPPQPYNPELNMNICSESSSDSSKTSTSGVRTSLSDPDPDLGDSNQSSYSPDKQSEPSGKSPDKDVHSKSLILTMPIIVQECEDRSPLNKIESRKIINSSQTTAAKRSLSSPRHPPYKKVKFRTVSEPAEDLFTPDFMVKKTSTSNPHFINLTVTSSENVQHPLKDERNKKGVENKLLLKIRLKQQSVQTKTQANSDLKIIKKTKQAGHNKGIKKLKLYGFGNSKTVEPQFYRKTQSAMAPVSVTIFNMQEPSHSYTDSSSAKQKVYSKWSSTFVDTTKKTSSHKKRKNSEKKELKSRTQALKRLVEDRYVLKEKQSMNDATPMKVLKIGSKLKCAFLAENV